MANELKNCPFCGGIEKVKCTLFMSVFQVQCFECKSSAYGSNNKDQAVTAWNTRPAAPVEGLDILERVSKYPHGTYFGKNVPEGTEVVARSQAEAIIAAKDDEIASLIPLAPNCGRYLAECNDGQLMYLNHANTWQGCPNFIAAKGAKIEDAMKCVEQLVGESKGLRTDNAALTARVKELEETVRDDITFAKGLKNQLAAARKALRNIAEDEGAPFRIKVHALATLEGEP